MSITYNLKYKKINYLGRPVLEKEGEIIVEQDSFCLKGKGGNDQGESIKFSDLKDVFVKEEVVVFSTIAKEKYYLTHFNNLMHDFVNDFMKMRNDFLIKALFLEQGEFKKEYDIHFNYLSKYGRTICKGDGKIRLFEKCIIVVPQKREVFSIPFDFLANQDVDDINYEITFTLDNEKKLIINHLNTMFDDFSDTVDQIREVMYQDIVNGLRSELPEFSATTILKLASLMKGGKATPVKQIKDIDAELWEKFIEVLLPSEEAKVAFEELSKSGSEENTYVGFRARPDAPEGQRTYFSWTLHSIPEKNIIATQLTSRDQINTHFFQIIIEHGDPKVKDVERIQEIDQTMLTFNFDTQVFSRDRRDLKKGKYRLALSKIPFLRSLRRSYLGRAYFKSKEDWMKYFNLLVEKSSKPLKKEDAA